MEYTTVIISIGEVKSKYMGLLGIAIAIELLHYGFYKCIIDGVKTYFKLA